MEVCTLSSLEMSHRRNELESDTKKDRDESTMIPESAAISVFEQ